MFLTVSFVIGLFLLIKGADHFVKGGSSLARRTQVSDLAIGLTVVAFGTSTPELFVNISASLAGDPAIAIGNILGSNIANVLLILGVSAVIHPLAVQRNTVRKEIPLSLLAAVLILVLTGDRFISRSLVAVLTRADGAVLLLFFMIFLFYIFSASRNRELEGVPKENHSLGKTYFFIISGLLGLIIGGRLVVDSAVKLASIWGVTESLVGLTIVAVGTSLPELATSAMAAYRKNPDIAIGNVVGSNIFNVFFILGASAVINPLPFGPRDQFDVVIVIMTSMLLFLCMFTGQRRLLDRFEGVVFLGLYLCYIVFLIKRG